MLTCCKGLGKRYVSRVLGPGRGIFFALPLHSTNFGAANELTADYRSTPAARRYCGGEGHTASGIGRGIVVRLIGPLDERLLFYYDLRAEVARGVKFLVVLSWDLLVGAT